MNHSYRLIWSEKSQTWVPVAEIVRARGKRNRSQRVLAAVTGLLMASSVVLANPQDGQVVRGQASISNNDNTVTINQKSTRAVLDWKSFSINKDETTRFVQPSKSAVALNRVTGQNPSQIHGNLTANGHVFLVNRNGVYFGKSAKVDVHGLVATTNDIGNDAFMVGNYWFNKPGKPNAEIVNQGSITIRESGLASFVAPSVRNDGLIQANLGKVSLGSGSGFTLDLYGDQLVELAVEPVDVENMVPLENTGNIEAQSVVLTANTARNIVDKVINVSGEIHAQTVSQDGGKIVLGSPTGTIEVSGVLNASATNEQSGVGGQVAINAERLISTQDSLIEVNATGVGKGGKVEIKADTLLQDGSITATSTSASGGDINVQVRYAGINNYIDVSGRSGGSISLNSDQARLMADLNASASSGKGGSVTLHTEASIQQVESSVVDVSSQSGEAGTITSTTTEHGRQYLSGSFKADGDLGGQVTISGGNLSLAGSSISAMGNNGGGSILVGGDTRGINDHIKNAKSLEVNESTTLDASARDNGDGGTIVLWSDERTIFQGTAVANAGDKSGDGGFIEVSSAGQWVYQGYTEVFSTHGNFGTLLLDPKNLTISNSVPAAGYQVVNLTDSTPSAGGAFGAYRGEGIDGTVQYVLNNGYIVVGAPEDDAIASGAGSVSLFKPDGTLISTLSGSTASDQVGQYVIPLGNANFVVNSPNWSDGATGNVGAVTWINGDVGLNGSVSTTNSLTGSTASDRVGSAGVTVLSNGNYVVASSNWDNPGTTVNAGAVTWVSGTSGTTGPVTISNSLYGTTDNDYVGNGRVTALNNGHYVVASPNWDNGTVDVGAVTWLDGTTATGGPVIAADSLYGSTASDQVGSRGITALTNGNFVVASPKWDGAAADVGAVTWGNGASAITGGPVSTSNSLYGSTASDEVGNYGITALINGNYVVVSPDWGAADVGAVTWLNGASGFNGAVATGNSLHGSATGDSVGLGGVFALTNGNYVVASPIWDNGGVVNAGAATWGDGANGNTIGAVTTTNSLHGTTANDSVSWKGVTVLNNGHYVVASPGWDNAGIDVGAVTWGNGDTGAVTGAVSTANSLYGSTDYDKVGDKDWLGYHGVVALTNGNYVVASPDWDSQTAVANVGAVTWLDGSAATAAAVSSANSLVGSAANDSIGYDVAALDDGNYAVGSPNWDNGATLNAGAVTWGSGVTGIIGTVSATNSLTGSQADQRLGRFVLPYSGGNSFLAWSLVSDTSGRVDLVTYNTGASADAGNQGFLNNAGLDAVITPASVTSILNTGTNLVLQANNDLSVVDAVNVNNATGNGGDLTLQAGRDVLINANIVTDNGNLNITANDINAKLLYRSAGAGDLVLGASVIIDTGTASKQFAVGSGPSPGSIQLNSDLLLASGDNLVGNVVLNSGTLSGNGTISGNLNQVGGTLAPGGTATAGSMAIQGNYTMSSTVGLQLDIGGTTAVSQYDVLNISGLATLDGALDIVHINSFVPTPVTTFTQMIDAAGGYSGIFAAVNEPAGHRYDLVQTGITTDLVYGREITITADDFNRIYGDTDPAFTATITGTFFSGDSSADITGLTYTPSSTQDSPIGTYSISADASAPQYYSLVFVDGTLTIDPRTLTPIFTGNNKVYDGTASATYSTGDDRYGTDNLVVNSSGSFTDKNVATGKTINISGIALTGTDAGNYVLASTTGTASADITALTLTPTFAGNNKVYDGTTSVSYGVTDDRIAGDVLTVNSSGSFVDKNVGTAKTVNITGINLTGTDSGNYVLASVTDTSSADITARTLTPTFAGNNKTYDGTTTATYGVNDNRIAGDLITVNSTGSFTDKNVGTGKTINISGINLTGGDAGNYVLGSVTDSTSADIIARTLTPTFIGNNKTYDGTTSVTYGVTDDRIAGDALTVNSSGSFVDKNVGAAKTINITGINLTGTDVGNYVLASVTDTSTADITARTLTPDFTAIDKVYDGTVLANYMVTDDRVVGDALTVGGIGSFIDRNVGTGKTVNISGINLIGTDAANYMLASTSAGSSANITPLASTSWTGGSTGSWSNPANWAGGALPDGSNVAAVVIPAGTQVLFDAANNPTILNNLTIGNSGGLEVAGSSLQVNGQLLTPGLNLSGGILGGSGQVIVSNGFSQTTGTLASSLQQISVTQTTGNLVFNNSQALSLGNVHALNGNISIQSTGNLVVNGKVLSDTGDVKLASSGGNISGLGYIGGTKLDLLAKAIGAPITPVQTQGDAIQFTASNGGVYLVNNNPAFGFTPASLNVSGSAFGDAVVVNYGATTVPVETLFSAGGNASITANSPLFINGSVTAGNNILLVAANTGNLVINGQVFSSGSGVINLNAPGGIVSGNIPAGAIIVDTSASSTAFIDQTLTQFLQGDQTALLQTNLGLSELAAIIGMPAMQELLQLDPDLLAVIYLETMFDHFLTTGDISNLPLPNVDDLGIIDSLNQLFELAYTPSDRSRFYSQLTVEQVATSLREEGEPELADFFERTAEAAETNEAELMELIDKPGMTNNRRVGYLGVFVRMRKLGLKKIFDPALAVLRKEPDFADVVDAGHSGGDIDLQMPDFIETDDGLVVLEGQVQSGSKLLNLRINKRWAFIDENGKYRVVLPVKKGESRIRLAVNDPSGKASYSTVKILSKTDGQLPQKQGRRVALFIGIDEYDNGIPNLDTPLKDVNAISAKLAETQGFEVQVLANPTKQEVLDKLSQFSNTLTIDDSLMVYYAGHGYMLHETGRGYWLPRDAGLTGPDNWISNRDVARIFHHTPAKQIMLVSDSCYSGAFIRGQTFVGTDPGVWNLRAVMGFSSGGEQPVWDGGGDGYSIFASKLLTTLGQGEIKGHSLYYQVKDKVTKVAPQVPGYSALLMPGYDAGADYILK